MINKEFIQLPIVQAEAQNLLNELECNKLEVKLSGFPGNRIRTVVNQNPKWYKLLFAQYYSGKRRGKTARSGVRRIYLIQALKRMSGGYYRDSISYQVMIDLIRDRLYNGYYIEEERIHIPPQLKIEPWEE